MNLFEKSIEKDELLEFALGKGEYYINDHEYGEHSVLISWINYILPLIENKGKEYVQNNIEKMLLKIMSSHLIDDKVKNENLIYQLHVYYYLKTEGRLKLSELNISVTKLAKKQLEGYVKFLNNNGDAKEYLFINAINLIKQRGGL